MERIEQERNADQLQRFNIELEQIKKYLKEARTDLQRKTMGERMMEGIE